MLRGNWLTVRNKKQAYPQGIRLLAVSNAALLRLAAPEGCPLAADYRFLAGLARGGVKEVVARFGLPLYPLKHLTIKAVDARGVGGGRRYRSHLYYRLAVDIEHRKHYAAILHVALFRVTNLKIGTAYLEAVLPVAQVEASEHPVDAVPAELFIVKHPVVGFVYLVIALLDTDDTILVFLSLAEGSPQMK